MTHDHAHDLTPQIKREQASLGGVPRARVMARRACRASTKDQLDVTARIRLKPFATSVPNPQISNYNPGPKA